MSNQNLNTVEIVTGEAILSFPNVFKPAKSLNGDMKYSVRVLIPKTDKKTIEKINNAIKAAATIGAQKHFNGTVPPKPKASFYDGDTWEDESTGILKKEKNKEYAGHMILNCSARENNKPKILDVNGDELLDETEIYSGVYGKVGAKFYAYSSNGNRGIACQLCAVKKTRDGEPLMPQFDMSLFDEK